MELKRKNLIICSMILLLFIVGYVYNNFSEGKYTATSFDVKFDDVSSELPQTDTSQGDTSKTDTLQAEAPDEKTEEVISTQENLATVEQKPETSIETTGSSFFSEYRLERDKNRSKEVEMWEDIINNQNAENTFKTLAQQELVKIVALTEKEMIIENLIISRGFSDAIVFLTDDSATVIVDAKELTAESVAQIQDIVVRKTKMNANNIKIMKKS